MQQVQVKRYNALYLWLKKKDIKNHIFFQTGLEASAFVAFLLIIPAAKGINNGKHFRIFSLITFILAIANVGLDIYLAVKYENPVENNHENATTTRVCTTSDSENGAISIAHATIGILSAPLMIWTTWRYWRTKLEALRMIRE